VSPLPYRRIAVPVEDTVNDDFQFVCLVEDAIGKPAEQGTTSVAMNFAKGAGIAPDSSKASIQGALELSGKALPLHLVPFVNLANVGLRRRREVNLHRFLVKELRTLCHERTSSG